MKHKQSFLLASKHFLAVLTALSPALAGWLIIYLSGRSPTLTENVYSKGIFIGISRSIAFITSIFSFSLAEVILFTVAVLVLWFVIKLIIDLIKCHENRFQLIYKRMLLAIWACSVVFLMFSLSTAPNYYRQTFSEQSRLDVRDSSVEELVALCEELVDEANKNVKNVSFTPEGDIILQNDSMKSSAQKALEDFNRLSSEYSFIPKVTSAPKPMRLSYMLSALKLTGFYFPYTAEANFNAHMPAVDIPTTMCHELAHTAGFMREDEANFLGYLACRDSTSGDFRYSASILAVTYALNALYTESNEDFHRIYSRYDPQLSSSLSMINAYWRNFDTPIAEISNTVNDAYLKLNKQSDGTKSYGRVLDLMLADYRFRHK